MKRIRLVLTAVVGAILFAFLYGCGKPNGQETEARANRARETSASPVGAKGTEEVAGGHSNGPGTITLSDGPQLVDGFDGTKANAQGSLFSRDGTVYEGELIEGQPSGQGTIINPNGTHQQGEWRQGKAYRVSGTWVARDGTKEVGTWNLDGTKSGGIITWKDGREYKGDWKCVAGAAELPDGMGSMTWPDGRKYVGRFRDGTMDGTGKMTYPDGKVEDGVWKQNKFVEVAK
jgi:hypothetical protein